MAGSMIGLLCLVFILSVIFILVCDLDVALIAIILIHIFAIGICWRSKQMSEVEHFKPISKLVDDEKYDIRIPEQYTDVVHELNTTAYNIKNENYDNLTDLNDFAISRPANSAYEMLEELLKTEDESADYKAASLSAEMARRNKQAANARARHNSESFRAASGLDEELDEADARQWFDRDQLDLDM